MKRVKAKAQRTKRASTADSARPLPDKISGKALAKLARLSPQRVSVLRRQGLSPEEIVAGIRLRGQRVARVATNGTGTQSTPTPASDPPGTSLAELQRQKLHTEISIKALDLAERRRDMVPIQHVRHFIAYTVSYRQAAADELHRRGGEIAEALVGKGDAMELQRIWEAAVTEIFHRLDAKNRQTLRRLHWWDGEDIDPDTCRDEIEALLRKVEGETDWLKTMREARSRGPKPRIADADFSRLEEAVEDLCREFETLRAGKDGDGQ